MTALLGKAGKQLFERHLEKYAPADPLYEFYTNDKGKQKRRKVCKSSTDLCTQLTITQRELPPGLSARDARILRKLKVRAHYLDKGFSFCGLRFGWTFLIGLIPLVGDAADASLNYLLIVRPARKTEIPPWLLRRMLLNNAISAGVGFVPVVGDVILAVYKANSRNVALLEEFLRIRGEEFIKMGGKGNSDDSAAPQKRWFTWNTIKSGDLSRADQEQVKPGAGMTALELKDSLPGLPPGAKNARPKKRQSTTPSASTSAPLVDDSKLEPISDSEPHPNSKKAKDSGSGSSSSGFSFFGKGKKKTATVKAEREAADSRFVEGAMDSTDGISKNRKKK